MTTSDGARPLLQHHPGRRHRLEAVAAQPRRRPQVPARPHRQRLDPAPRHLGPPRAALRRAADHGRHRRARTAPPSRRSSPPSPTTTSCSRASRRTRPPRSASPRPSCVKREPDVIIGSFAADHVIADPRGFGRAVREAIAAADAGYIATIGITPDRARDRLRLHPRAARASTIEGAPQRRDGRPRSSRSPTSRPPRATSPTATTSGTGACSSRAPTRLLEQLGETRPELLAGLLELAEAWDTPRAAPSSTSLAEPREDRHRLHGRRARRRRGAPRRHPGRLRLGRRRRLRLDRQAALGRPQERPRHPRRERARALRRVERHRRQPERPAHLADRRERHRRGRHPGRAAGHDEANAQRVKSVVDALKLSGRSDVL